jgi:hypothetical protein
MKNLQTTFNKTYAENMKKIMGAVWELPAKQHSQSSPFPLKLGLIFDTFLIHIIARIDGVN